MRLFAILALGLAASACGPGVRLEAEPDEIKADGVASTTITFHDDRADGTSVYFETDRGHFDDAGYEAESITRSLAGGRVSVELFSSIYPGTATVTATTDYGSATTTVEFLPMRPSGRNVTFECDAVNIGALDEPTPDVAAACHLYMRDREGAPIDPRALASGDFGFMAEAGLVHPSVADDGYGDVYFLYTATGGDGRPRDVAPITNEPSRSGDTGGTRNPRDGLVTIVAWVRGEEGFQDVNSNGLFEPELGETFVDMGEPFVDVDDDGLFDAGVGDVSIDLDGNGRHDGPNGRWDEDTVVWTTFKILWTGPPHESEGTSRIELGGGRDIAVGATREVVAFLLDRNMNPVAAGSDDQITVYPTCSYCEYPSNYSFGLSQTRGFEIDAAGGILGNLFEPPAFSISVTNINTYTEPETFRIEVSADSTPAPMTSDGSAPYAVTYTLTPYEARLLGAPE